MPKRDIGPKTRAFVAQLRTFCQSVEGRGARLAEYLEMPPAKVYAWWRLTDRWPTTEQLLGAMDWMSQQKD